MLNLKNSGIKSIIYEIKIFIMDIFTLLHFYLLHYYFFKLASPFYVVLLHAFGFILMPWRLISFWNAFYAIWTSSGSEGISRDLGLIIFYRISFSFYIVKTALSHIQGLFGG